MKTEYIRNLQNNYERIYLEEKPEEKRYQYCILSRGGIKGLLSCSLRYMDGEAYLYYDITSKQNLVQYFQKEKITREWFLDFMDSIKRLQKELERFLLQDDNILWDPEQIFQDLENNVFSFLYVPYYEGKNQFLKLLGFMVEKIDYEDERLVECVYKLYEQLERNGEIYLREQIFQDIAGLSDETVQRDRNIRRISERIITDLPGEEKNSESHDEAGGGEAKQREDMDWDEDLPGEQDDYSRNDRMSDHLQREEKESPQRKFLGIFEGKKQRKGKDLAKPGCRPGVAETGREYRVAEEPEYEDEAYGRTAYISERQTKREVHHRLFYSDGRKASNLDISNLLIGKYKDKVDLFLDDESVSRMHARILTDQDDFYLEDSNSTNGTFINRSRLQPYERKKLESGDEIRIGNVVLFFR